MKALKLLAASAVIAASSLMAGPGPISDIVPVIANVMPECAFVNQGTAPELNFGDYYAYSSTGENANSSIFFKCVENTPYEVSVTSQNGDKLLNGGSSLSYTWDATGDMGGVSDSSVALREIQLAANLPGAGSQVLDNLTTGEHLDNLVVEISY